LERSFTRGTKVNKIYDYIIVGAGIGGLFSALQIPREKDVLILSKDVPWEANSFYAQGGISVARGENDINSHIEDTFLAGGETGDREMISTMVADGIDVIDELIEMELQFDKDENGNLLYTKEGAHSTNRILHLGGDATGRYMHSFMLSKIQHPILYEVDVTDILAYDSVCYGVTVETKGEFQNIYAKNVILASGGIGSIYRYNTNARGISGDIQGIAIEKGIKLRDMEMLQFHPTVVTIGDVSSLLSEAVRGEGAYVVDEDGERFLFQYDKRGELASRDIVSRAILKHKKKAFLQISHFEEEWFWKRFPTISKFLDSSGFKLTSDLIPISPAFHYAIGGIVTDKNGLVDDFQNLYAVGEIASTGVHGANRLASNSLLEALVFAKRAVVESLKKDFSCEFKEFPVNAKKLEKEGDDELRKELRSLMWRYVSIERNEKGMRIAEKRVNEMLNMKIGRKLKLQLLTAHEIIRSAIENRESKGVHYRTDI
jgi:L-aspartate oxidase